MDDLNIPTSHEGGPYLQAACFCDQILEDKSGTLSLIRIVDRIFHQQPGSNPPESMPPFTHTLNLVVMLKAGAALGRNTLRIVPELPNGSTKESLPFDLFFEGEERGSNVVLTLAFTFEQEGLYWFEVHLGEILMTKIPLRVIYRRVVTTQLE